MPQVTNRRASQALNGQDVKVTLNASDATNILPTLVEGTRCATVSSGLFGTISRIDYDGNSFLVTPNTMAATFSSTSTPGYLANGELINIV